MPLLRDLVTLFTGPIQEKAEARRGRLAEMRIERVAHESWLDDMQQIVNPLEGTEGWLTGDAGGRDKQPVSFRMKQIVIRQLCEENAFAEPALDAVVDYVIGTGWSYRWVVPKVLPDGVDRGELQSLADLANQVWSEFVQREKWNEMEASFTFAYMRDGEAFLRLFESQGDVFVRYVDALEVRDTNGTHQWGIELDKVDQQNPLAYFIHPDGEDPERVEASEIVHAKTGTDPDIPRGVPPLWVVRFQLYRASRILESTGRLAITQSKIAAIRKHTFPGQTDAQKSWVDSHATKTATSVTGETIRQKHIPDGTMLDVGHNVEVTFPPGGVTLPHFPPAVVAQLRAVCARLGIPDFALTCDASGANFAGIFVSMAPSTKRLQRTQASLHRAFARVHRAVFVASMESDMLPEQASLLEQEITAPEVSNRDEVSQTNKREVLFRNKVLSPRTWAGEEGYDYDEERRNIDADETAFDDPIVDMPPNAKQLPGMNSTGHPSIDAAVAAATAEKPEPKSPPPTDSGGG